MTLTITVREEGADDAPIIAEIVQRTYLDIPYSDHREHIMVDRLRGTDAYVPQLSLIADVGGVAVGHILLTRAFIRTEMSDTATLALAPLSVLPAFRRKGVGKLLIQSARDRAIALGFKSILVVGIAHYYEQFGFEPLNRYPISLPFSAPPENCKILPLQPHALDNVAGLVHYARGWLEH